MRVRATLFDSTAQHSTAQHSTAQHIILYIVELIRYNKRAVLLLEAIMLSFCCIKI